MESYLNITIRVAKAQAEAALASLRGQLGTLDTAMRSSGGALNADQSTRSVDRLTGSLRSAGYALSATFTLPIIGAGKTLLKFALDNQTAMADLKKVYGDNPLANYNADITALGKNFEALSNAFGVNQTEVIQIGAAWAAAGVQGAALSQSVANTLKAMVIGDIDSKEATQALISIQGQYGASAADLTKILNVLNVVENETGISMEGLIVGFQRAAGAAANGGVTYRELASMLAAITPYAGTAAQAGNSLKTIISNLEAPSSAASQVLKLLGINIGDVGWKSATATDKLTQVAVAFHGLSNAQQNVAARALSGAFQLSRFDVLLRDIYASTQKGSESNSRYGKSLHDTEDANRNAAIAARELDTVLQSNPKRLQILSDVIKNSLADVIQKLIPLIISIAGIVEKLVTWFSHLSPWVQQLVGYFLLFAAALGPVLLYISALASAFNYIGPLFGLLLSPLKIFPILIGLAFSPIRVLLGLLGLLGGLFSRTGKEATVGAVETGASIKEMVASIEAMMRELLYTVEAIWANMTEVSVAGAKRTRAATTAAFADTAVVAEEAMAATEGVVATTFEGIVATFTAGGAAAVDIWRGTWGLIWDETVISSEKTIAVVEKTVEIWMGTWGLIYDETVVGMTKMLETTEKGLVLWNAEFAAAQMRNVEIINEGFLAQTAATRAGMMEIEGTVIAGGVATERGFMATLIGAPGKILGFFIGLPGKLLGLFMGIPGMIGRALSGIVPALLTVGRGVLAALTGPWGIAIAAVLLIVALFRKQIVQAWQSVVDWFKNGAGGLASAFQPVINLFQDGVKWVIDAFNMLPQGVQNALLAVVHIVEQAAMAVYKLFSYLNPFAHHSPSLVENVTAGMAEVAKQFATVTNISGPINKAYADIKRFGEEVASLAAKGQAITISTNVADIQKSGGGAGAVNAYLTETADVAALTAKQNALNNVLNIQQGIVDKLDAQIQGYNDKLKAEQAILAALQVTQAAAQEGMNQASANLQKYQSTGIEGQKAMSDAIFASQMKEKALQLEMMKIEDVTGPMATVQQRMQTLQGSMDMLRGTSKALRSAGASGDITAVYDQQVTAMQKQYDTTKAQVSQYDALNKQLTDAQHKTQELQLQDSLTYDPLTKQINDAATAMKELPFDEILKGVQDNKAALTQFTDQYNVATAAVKEQEEVIKNLTAARDAIQAKYDVELHKLDQLKKAYQDIGQVISDLNAEISKMLSATSTINQAKAAKAQSNVEKNFAAGAGGNFPSALGAGGLGGGKAGDIAGIDAETKKWQDQLKNSLGKIDPFAKIKEKWHQFEGWWKGTVTPGAKNLWDSLFGGGGKGAGAASGIFKSLGDGAGSLLKFLHPVWTAINDLWKLFKPDILKLWGDLKDAFMQIGNNVGPKLLPFLSALWHLIVVLWPTVKLLAEVIGGVLLAAIKIVADIFVNVLGTALHWIIATIADLLQVLTGLINFVVGVFTGDWKRAWKGLVDIVAGTFYAIWHLIEASGKLLWGVVKGIVTGIVNFFKWLFDVLVGHSIIPDMIKAIVGWFAKLPGMALKALEQLGKFLVKLFVDAFNAVLDGITAVWSTIWNWLSGLPGEAVKALAGMGKGLLDSAKAAFGFILDGYKFVWKTINGWLGGRPAEAVKYLAHMGEKLLDWAKAAFNKIKDGFVAIWNGFIVPWFTGRPDDAIKFLSSLGGKLLSWASSAFSKIMDGFTGKWNSITNWLGGIPGAIIRGIGDIGNLLYDVGSNIIDGLGRGIGDAIGKLGGVLGHVADFIPGWLKKILHISSPSKVMAIEIGGPITQGIGVGIADQIPFVMNKMKDVSNAVMKYKFAPIIAPKVQLPTASSFAGNSAVGAASNTQAPLVPASGSHGASGITYHSEDKSVTVHVEKLELPNIKSSADADELLKSLEALANGSR